MAKKPKASKAEREERVKAGYKKDKKRFKGTNTEDIAGGALADRKKQEAILAPGLRRAAPPKKKKKPAFMTRKIKPQVRSGKKKK